MNTLVQIGSAGIETLILNLGRRGGYVREYAVKALGEIGDIRAIEPLVPCGWVPPGTSQRGDFGAPYCSNDCYTKAARHAMLEVEPGTPCGMCGSPIRKSRLAGGYGVVPCEGKVLVICQTCAGTRAVGMFQSFGRCCKCGKLILSFYWQIINSEQPFRLVFQILLERNWQRLPEYIETPLGTP